MLHEFSGFTLSESRFFPLLSLILISFLVLKYVQWKKSRSRLYRMAVKIPYIKDMNTVPVLGHAHHFIGDTEYILNKIFQFGLKSVSPAKVWLGHYLFFTIDTPEHLEIALNSNRSLQKHNLYRFTVPLTGSGLFNLEEKTWKVHRKFINPTFSQVLLNSFVEVFTEQSNILVKILEKNVGAIFDIEEHVTKCTLESVIQTSMGVTTDMQTTDCQIVHVLNKGLDIMMVRMFNVLYHSDFIFNISKHGREERAAVKEFKEFVTKEVISKKENYKQKIREHSKLVEADIFESPMRKAFLDHLIEISETNANFTDEEIVNEVQTFLIAGSDTSATVISFTLICLAMFPDIQQKVYEEIIEVCGLERDLDYHDLPNLKYLEKVIKETLRVFPIGPSIVREVTDDLKMGDYVLPRGSGLVLMIFNLHRNPKYYPDPLKFDPERFSPEESAKRHPYSYLAFSGGPRNCIGLKYGMMLVKTVVATLSRRYFMETTYKKIEDVRVKQSLIIKSVLGFPIKLTKRLD